MKTKYSRVYRHHWRKAPTTYIKSKQNRGFKGLGNKKLSSYIQGNASKQKELNAQINVFSTQKLLMTEVSIESFRMTLTRLLGKQYVKASWCYQLCKHTHIILRQHKLPQGGVVDRISMGMRLAYGTPFARAAKCDKNELILKLNYNPGLCKYSVLKHCIKKASSKLAKPLLIKKNK